MGRQRYGRPVDCWAIGVVMYILWVHTDPLSAVLSHSSANICGATCSVVLNNQHHYHHHHHHHHYSSSSLPRASSGSFHLCVNRFNLSWSVSTCGSPGLWLSSSITLPTRNCSFETYLQFWVSMMTNRCCNSLTQCCAKCILWKYGSLWVIFMV